GTCSECCGAERRLRCRSSFTHIAHGCAEIAGGHPAEASGYPQGQSGRRSRSQSRRERRVVSRGRGTARLAGDSERRLWPPEVRGLQRLLDHVILIVAAACWEVVLSPSRAVPWPRRQ